MVNNAEGYNAYLRSKVMTATPAELTLMLYEGAIKFVNKAIMSIEKDDVMGAHNNLMKTQRIIEELRASLDHKYPVAKEFDTVYEYILRRLVEANIKKDKDILGEVLEHLRTTRDTWKEVMKNANAPQSASR